MNLKKGFQSYSTTLTIMDKQEKGKKITQDLHSLMRLARAMGYYNVIVAIGLPPGNGDECGAMNFCSNRFMLNFNKEYVQKHIAIATENIMVARNNLEMTVFNYGKNFQS